MQESFSKYNRGKLATFLENRAIHLFNNPAEMRECEVKSNKETIKQKGICCFSESDKALLMWSHYANKNKGVCLTFDVFQNEDLFKKIAFKVEYPEKYPIHNWPKDRGTFHSLRLLIATKSREWEYENEIRIVRDFHNVKDKFRGKVEFNKRALSAVKFGFNIDKSEPAMIKAILDKIGGYEHVKFYKAKLKQFEFGIEFEELFF